MGGVKKSPRRKARRACGRTLSRRASVQARPPAAVHFQVQARPPAAVHFPGRRRPAAVLHALLYRSFVLKGGGGGVKKSPRRKNEVSRSPTRKIGDPLYTTFQKIFTIIRIFLKSEAPKAPGLFTFVHRGGLEKGFSFVLAWACRLHLATMKPSHNTEKRNTRKTAPLWLSRPR